MGTNEDPTDRPPTANAGALPPAAEASEADATAWIVSLSNGLSDTLRTAEALVSSRRRIDLAGLDEQVRALCARVLTLPPEDAPSMRVRLLGLLARTDALLAALTMAAQAAPPP